MKIKCSECGNIEDIEIIDHIYEDQYPELQLAGDKKCSKCGKLLVVYLTTYLDNNYDSGK